MSVPVLPYLQYNSRAILIDEDKVCKMMPYRRTYISMATFHVTHVISSRIHLQSSGNYSIARVRIADVGYSFLYPRMDTAPRAQMRPFGYSSSNVT